MSIRPEVLWITDIASGVLWAAAYVLIIRRGFLDRTYGMPLAGLIFAITWELIFAILRPATVRPSFIVPTWLAIDFCILYQYLRYGPAEHQRVLQWMGAGWFYMRFAAGLAGAFWLQYAFILDTADWNGDLSGLAVNVVISVAFIAMLERRCDIRGQSMYIALTKFLGSAVLIPHAYPLYGLRSLPALLTTVFICDITYIVLLHRQCRAQGIRPWARL